MKRSFPVFKGLCTYFFKSKNQHGIHSPFLFDLYNNVLNSSDQYYVFSKIEQLRKAALKDSTLVPLSGLGTNNKKETQISAIAKNGICTQAEGERYFKLVSYLKPKLVFELGTSLGISSLYFSKALSTTQVVTFEGNTYLCEIAKANFKYCEAENIQLVQGDIDVNLPIQLKKLANTIDLVFIDANHTLSALQNYIALLKPYLSPNALLIIDDISWSDDMRNAWQLLLEDATFSLTFENVKQGFLFTGKQFTKQHFYLRF